MPQRSQMHANLMSAAGARESANDAETFVIRAARESLLDAEIRARRRAQRVNRLLQPDRRRQVLALPRQWRINGTRLPFRPAPDNRQIFFRDPLLLHEQTKTPRGGRVLCHENEAAGFAIEPVDDGNLAAIRDLESEELFQFAPQRSRAAWLRRMHEQERRLLHDDEVFALRDDGEIMAAVCARCLRGG